MHVSLSELATTITKAGIAVGLDQGSAQVLSDIAKFTTHSEPCTLHYFSHALVAFDEQSSSTYIESKALTGEFRAKHDRPLSAVTVAAPLRDTLLVECSRPKSRRTAISLLACDYPAIILQAALSVSDVSSVLLDYAIFDDGDEPVFLPLTLDELQRETAGLLTHKTGRCMRLRCNQHGRLALPPVHSHAVNVDEAVWETLLKLANRLLVPATQASRRKGAGPLETD